MMSFSIVLIRNLVLTILYEPPKQVLGPFGDFSDSESMLEKTTLSVQETSCPALHIFLSKSDKAEVYSHP